MKFTKKFILFSSCAFFFLAVFLHDTSCFASAATALTNAVPVLVSLSTGEEQLYSIEVPSEATGLEVSLAGGTGDLDLYTRYGTPPDTDTYDCRPYLDGNDETCTHAVPSEGIWYIMTRGYTAGNATLTATYVTGHIPATPLSSGTPVSLSISRNEEQLYSIEVPSEATGLEVSLSGGTGDLDLYTRYGTPPDTDIYDCRPYLDGNNETCFHTEPSDGTWFVMVKGYLTGSSTLVATSTPTFATCSDGEKNGDEAGVDCGGSCTDTCGDGSIFVDQQLTSACLGGYSISDRNCTGSDGHAYSTINEAMQDIEDGAGGVIVIRGGIYGEEVTINRSGNQDAYLVIKAYPGESPIIDGGGSLPSTSYHDGLVSAAFRSYLHIQGLTIRNSRYMGFHAYHCDHIRIIDCTVHDVQDGGICFNIGTDILIDNCEVHHSNQEGSAAMHEAVTVRTVDTFEISNTVVHDCEEEGIDVKYHATNGSIHDCHLENNILFIDKAHHIDIHNNIINNSGILLGIETGG
ncbi:MAG: hypothetical protein D3909_13220, partial [Candidatus Electrothrix sp. ATG1]|nr:hypothetical protein [Candidatus Electrothrix sp. ATG1]